MATYAEIKTRITNILVDADMDSFIDGSLGFVNSVIRQLEIGNTYPYMFVRDSTAAFGSFSNGTTEYTSTVGIKDLLQIWYAKDDIKSFITEISNPQLNAVTPNVTPVVAPPSTFAITQITDDNYIKIKLNTNPDTTYVSYASYVGYSAELSGDTDTNWLTKNFPDLLIYGAVLESIPVNEHDERMGTWLAKYNAAKSVLDRQTIVSEMSANGISVMPSV